MPNLLTHPLCTEMTNSPNLDYAEQCPTAIVSLNNGALESQGSHQGLYQINGTHIWTSVSHAIWYHSEFDAWLIGNKENIGEAICGIYAYDNYGGLDDANNEWYYYSDIGWIPASANDIFIHCTSKNNMDFFSKMKCLPTLLLWKANFCHLN